MIDEKKLISEIKKLYSDNSQRIKECEGECNEYYLGKNFAYIEVNSIIHDMMEGVI